MHWLVAVVCVALPHPAWAHPYLLLLSPVCVQGSNHVQRKLKDRLRGHKKLESTLGDQFTTGRLYACISR